METIDTPAARATDPCTSHEAAERHTASGKRRRGQQQVLDAMIEHGQRGITSDELAQVAGLDRHLVGRRLPELREAGYLFIRGYPDSPERRKSTVSGRTGMVWRPVAVGTTNAIVELGNPPLQVTSAPGEGLFPRQSRAVWSPCQRYRYLLERVWGSGPTVCWVMCNPSTADAQVNDPTLERCERFSVAWGFGGMVVANLFAWRATDPDEMRAAHDPIGPDNNRAILAAARQATNSGGLIVCAWGNHGHHLDRGAEVVRLLIGAGHDLHNLGISAQGSPLHPLYLRKDLEPRAWPGARRWA